MNIFAKPGAKVRFLNQDGTEWDLKDAQKYFGENEILTVKEVEIGGWASEVTFTEFPFKSFNTVMFEDVED